MMFAKLLPKELKNHDLTVRSVPCPWTTSYKDFKGCHPASLALITSLYPWSRTSGHPVHFKIWIIASRQAHLVPLKTQKAQKNSFCHWGRSHVSKQMSVGGPIRSHCSKRQIIKQMLRLFSVLNLALLAANQPAVNTQNDSRQAPL